jgi:hypothetical protein
MSKNKDAVNTAIGLSTNELSDRFGSANAEFLKGLRGIDYETGFEFDRSLLSIKEYKINPDYVDQNIKQQAGYSAEVASVSRKNAESIIEGSETRFLRSEDRAGYGKNNSVVDILEINNEQVASQVQMKFVGDKGLDDLLEKIANGENKSGKNDLSRYLINDEIQLPSDQVESAITVCQIKYEENLRQAERLKLDGEFELAQQKEHAAINYKELEGKISDSGLTTEEAIEYRLNPEKMTAKDIAKTSHRAGLEGAKFGAAIGGSVSLIINIISAVAGEKDFSEAAVDVLADTSISAGVGYGSAFTGSTIKGSMQQSSSEYVRALSGTALPVLAVSACIACSGSILSYAQGDIGEAELLKNVGGNASGMLSCSMFAGIGQVVIPIPVLGGLIGGMVGYTVSNIFYQEFFNAFDDAKRSKEELNLIKQKCRAAKKLAESYQASLDSIFDRKLSHINVARDTLYSALNNNEIDIKDFCEEVNSFANTLGKNLKFENKPEFDEFMASNEVLKF